MASDNGPTLASVIRDYLRLLDTRAWSAVGDYHEWPGCADDCTHPSHRDTHAEWRELNDDAAR